MSYLKKFLQKHTDIENHLDSIAQLATLDRLKQTNPVIAKSIINELTKQRNSLKLIASENYSSIDTQIAMSNLLTDKYAEGHPFHRFYAGCENVDHIEDYAAKLAAKNWGMPYAYTQPHSGADANLVAFWSVLIKKVETPKIAELGKKNVNQLTEQEYQTIRNEFSKQKILGMALDCGGHLTHGSRVNISSKQMQAISYGVNPDTHEIDYVALEKIAMEERPLILLAGYSASPKLINFAKMRHIADKCGATLIADMAHLAGLIVGGAIKGIHSPVGFADIITSTTHKTLRGPRGGLILSTEEYEPYIAKGCPMILGGPLAHVIAAKAVAFEEASKPEFKVYAEQVIKNAKALCSRLMKNGVFCISHGTENHLILFDAIKSFNLNGRQAENALAEANITANRNTIPFDPQGPWYCSGIRIGPVALTTRGMKEREMEIIADLIYDVLKGSKPKIDPTTGKPSSAEVDIDKAVLQDINRRLKELLNNFPLYPEIEIDEE